MSKALGSRARTLFSFCGPVILRRNSLGLKLRLATAETGDAAELVARLGPRGQFNSGYSNLSEVAGEISNAKEGHHFYPVLFYFRFREPYYAVSRFTLVALDTVTFIKSALDDEEHGWLKESAAVTQLWRGSLLLVTTLEETFLGGNQSDSSAPPPDPQTVDLWRRRYGDGVRRLREMGIQTVGDEQSGADVYVSLRRQWHPHITRLAPAMAYHMREIDTAGAEQGRRE